MNISVSNPARSSGKNKANRKSVKRDKIQVSVKDTPSPRQGSTKKAFKSLSPNLTQQYYDSLVDPFEHGGPRLGWGCMTPSAVTQIYIRGTTTANADGSLALLAIPSSTNFLSVYNGGAAVGVSGGVAATDSAALAANFSSGRCISIGLKAFPSIAATSAPGVVYSGAIDSLTTTLYSALTPNDFISFPTSRQDIASLGASATGRPVDTDTFAFSPALVDGTGFVTTTKIPFSLPFIAFSGLPASASVAYEAVCNIEALYLTKHSSAGIGAGTWGDTLANYWPSFESAWSKIQPYLPSPGQAFSGLVNKVIMPATHSMLGRLAGATPRLQMSPGGRQQLALPYYNGDVRIH